MYSAEREIRDALAGERAGLEELQWRASLVWEETRDELLAHPDAIEVPAEAIAERRLRVAVIDGRPVGFSLLLPVEGGACELDGLFVEPDAMRDGIGRALIADACELARSRGASRIEVTANPRALGFDEKVGFSAGHEVRTRFGPGLRMTLELPAS